MDVFEWIETTLKPEVCTSDRFIYDDMESQSGRSLPLIYQPFDGTNRSHWRDRGALFDFLHAVLGEGKRLLDFGPGDGWPSLIVAPYAAEVTGVDGSRRRVAVCTENAARLGFTNAHFHYAAPGSDLPFPAYSFDGVMAASSVEQSPDPRRTLTELYRVLKPGGRLRVNYESFTRDRRGMARECETWPIDAHHCRLILYDRDFAGERAVQYSISYALSEDDLTRAITSQSGPITFESLNVPALAALCAAVIDARVCTTIHASGRTLAAWLGEIGFREVLPTYDGSDFAGSLFDAYPEAQRPQEMAVVDALLRPAVAVVIGLPAPLALDPPITAVK
jgi:ubiquinone/menaquinone biosynthesis C-methylase UbiE